MSEQIQPLAGLTLWDEVQTTDPAYTKSFQRSNGFEGTSVNPMYLVRKATEKFGPIGIGWGIDTLDEQWKEGHAIGFPTDGGEPTRVVVHVLKVELWYELGGKRGSVKQFGQTTFVGRAADGTIYTNEDAPKMSMTDAMSKCLSLLGFSADVYMGLHDDAKYVADLEAAFSAGHLTNARNATPPSEQRRGQERAGQQAGATEKLSERYENYKERLKKGAVEDKAGARKIIEQDSQLSEFERKLLLSSQWLQEAKPTAAINPDNKAFI